MEKFGELKVFSLKVDSKFQIVGTNKNIITFFKPEDVKAIIAYLYTLKSDITVISTKIKLNNKIYPVIIEGYRADSISYLDIYEEKFFFDGNSLLSSDIMGSELTFVYNISMSKIVYLKTKNDFLVLNNITKLNPSLLSALSLNKDDLEKMITTFVKSAKADKKASKIIKLSIYNNEHHYKLDFYAKSINGRKYLVINANVADDIVVYQNQVRYYTKDALTGLLDYKGIQDSTKYMIDIEQIKEFAFVILDVEYLDAINNMYGQIFVDQLIKLISTVIQDTYKDEFSLARITNYKFILLLKETGTTTKILAQLKLLENRLKGLKYKDSPISIRFASGIAIYDVDGKDFEQLYIKASKALIHSKKTNGTVCFYNDKQHAKYNILLSETSVVSKREKKKSELFLRKIIDKLLVSKDISKTIDDILAKLIEFYSLDRVVLMSEINSKKFSFICCSNEKYKNSFKDVTMSTISEFDDAFDSENMAVVNNVEAIKYISKERYYHMQHLGVKSEIMFNLKNDNIDMGYFVLHKCDEQHFWTEDEKMNISIISKLISSVLVTMENERYMENVAYLDSVTGYWNLNMLKEEIKQKNLIEYTLLSFDISKFHIINDTYGYDAGDKFLRDIAEYLRCNLKESELFCRIVDDKFLIITECWDKDILINKYHDLRFHVQQYLRKHHGISLDVRVGVYFKKNSDTLSEAMDKANRALNSITEYMNDKINFYSEIISKEEEQEKFIESHIDQAFENEEFIIFLQPCIDVKKNKLYGAEALVRWKLEDRILYPNSFIPLLEKNHKIIELDFAVYEQVFKYVKFLMNQNITLFPISMNVSRCHLLSNNFIPRLLELVRKYGVDPQYISLEITESAFVSGLSELKDFINDLKKHGFRIYIDDFGIAYSNISLLGQIPVDVLKIDKCFLDHEVSKREYVILNNIANMARELGMRVLCEGIEGEKELSIVKSLKFDYGQGYHFDKPLPLDVFNEKYVFKKSK